MSKVFVTGHRNPDTDSIVAAIAYTNLRHALGEREYEAARIGSVNDETQRMLDRFGFEPPVYIKNMRTQVRDLEFDRPPVMDNTVTMDLAWRTMREQKIATLPVTNPDGTLYGMLSAGDIASFDMETLTDSHIERMPLFNLLSVLEGRLVNEYDYIRGTVSGDVVVALPGEYEALSREDIIICGNQPEVVDAAIAAGVACVIICRSDIEPRWVSAGENTAVISTPIDCRRVSRLVYQAAPVGLSCIREGIVTFHLNDYLDDVRESLSNSRFRSYPVLDENEKVVGTLSRFHIVKPRRKQVVLVDHNELVQSVPGLDQAEILEIIDHHRLADIQTSQPISVRNEPVGSTNTIITAMYQERGVMPSPAMAGLMASAIISDTVMFKSPTCTKKDVAMAERLARIARISLDDLGEEIFSSSGMADKSADDLFFEDYKKFHISEQNIGVSQITCADSAQILARRDEFMQVMEKRRRERGCDLIILMITDVLLEGSHLFYSGSDETIRQAFNVEPQDSHVFLPGVMSRKKQIIPMLTALWG